MLFNWWYSITIYFKSYITYFRINIKMITKIAYISGPISGLENGNFDNFQKAQIKLEKEGYVVMNPHEIGKDLYQKWSKIPKPENTSEAKAYDEQMWREFMREDIKHLTIAECVFLLDNWETSRGSHLELLIAQKLGIPIYYMRDYSPFDITFQISKFDRIPV